MTTEIDSDTPSSHPFITIIPTTLTMTTPTLRIDRTASMMFYVAINKIRKAKIIAQVIPLMADVKKAFSDCIQHQ